MDIQIYYIYLFYFIFLSLTLYINGISIFCVDMEYSYTYFIFELVYYITWIIGVSTSQWLLFALLIFIQFANELIIKIFKLNESVFLYNLKLGEHLSILIGLFIVLNKYHLHINF